MRQPITEYATTYSRLPIPLYFLMAKKNASCGQLPVFNVSANLVATNQDASWIVAAKRA
jgi:hypothetical protein